MPVTTENDIVTIAHSASGASAKVHLFGATVISYVSSDGRENLFVSSKAALDGSKPIRGGIPIVFPIFGASKDSMPQHGFARRNKWNLKVSWDEEVSAGATFTLALKDAKEGRGGDDCVWSLDHSQIDETDCLLTYDVRVQDQQLTSTLKIDNTGNAAFDFKALFHTYYKVDDGLATDPSKTYVHGLGGYAITDKITGDSGHVQSYDEDVTFAKEVDQIFIHPEDHPVVHAKIGVGSKELRLETAGQIDEQPMPVSCVLWNPHEEKAKALEDFGDQEYKDMICVEPGLIGHQPILDAGKQARLSQTIIVPK